MINKILKTLGTVALGYAIGNMAYRAMRIDSEIHEIHCQLFRIPEEQYPESLAGGVKWCIKDGYRRITNKHSKRG